VTKGQRPADRESGNKEGQSQLFSAHLEKRGGSQEGQVVLRSPRSSEGRKIEKRPNINSGVRESSAKTKEKTKQTVVAGKAQGLSGRNSEKRSFPNEGGEKNDRKKIKSPIKKTAEDDTGPLKEKTKGESSISRGGKSKEIGIPYCTESPKIGKVKGKLKLTILRSGKREGWGESLSKVEDKCLE